MSSLDYALSALRMGTRFGHLHRVLARRFGYMPFVYSNPLDFQAQLNRAFLLCWMDIKLNRTPPPFMFSNEHRTIVFSVQRDFSVRVLLLGHLSLGTVPDLLDRIRQAGCAITQAEVRLQRYAREDGLGLEAAVRTVAFDPGMETCNSNVACDEARVFVLKPPESETATDPATMFSIMLRSVYPPENPLIRQTRLPAGWSLPPEDLERELSDSRTDVNVAFDLVRAWAMQPQNANWYTLQSNDFITNKEFGGQFHANDLLVSDANDPMVPRRAIDDIDEEDEEEDTDSNDDTRPDSLDPEEAGDDQLPLPALQRMDIGNGESEYDSNDKADDTQSDDDVPLTKYTNRQARQKELFGLEPGELESYRHIADPTIMDEDAPPEGQPQRKRKKKSWKRFKYTDRQARRWDRYGLRPGEMKFYKERDEILRKDAEEKRINKRIGEPEDPPALESDSEPEPEPEPEPENPPAGEEAPRPMRRLRKPLIEDEELSGSLARIAEAIQKDSGPIERQRMRDAEMKMARDSMLSHLNSINEKKSKESYVRFDERWGAVPRAVLQLPLWQAQDAIASQWPSLTYQRWFTENGGSKCFLTEHGSVTREFNQSQEFLRRWFSPALKEFGIHGVLVNTSTGSGKTCAAVAAATTSFIRTEKDGPGFDVVWWISRPDGGVKNTRNKELLQKTCSVITQQWIKAGHKLPRNLLNQSYEATAEGKQFLQNKGDYADASGWGWMNETASFKQFLHYTRGVAEWTKKVHSVAKQWGGEFPNDDPLYRTLIVMDEAHNAVLDRGHNASIHDIKIEEFYEIQAALQRSQKLSGENGCMTLMLSATPGKGGIVNGFRLLNCLRAQNDFPNTPEQLAVLTSRNPDGLLSERQLRQFAELAKGFVVYTDASFDPGRMPVVRVHYRIRMEATPEQRKMMKRCATLKDRAKCLRQYGNSIFGKEDGGNISTIDGSANKQRFAQLKEVWRSSRGMQPGKQLTPAELNPFFRYHKELQAKSPLADTMLSMIRRLDEDDMKAYKRRFKHFIVCAESGAYGAKFLAWVFLVGGYRFCESRHGTQMKYGNLTAPNPEGGSGFICVTSTSMFNCESKPNYFLRLPGGHDDACRVPNAQLPEELDGLFNAPYNANGQYVRFCIFDKSLMEGMDVYDTPYVHLFGEMSAADKRQAVGRVTRHCGSSCLPRLYSPYKGWPVTVCEYLIDQSTNGLVVNVNTVQDADRNAHLAEQFDSLCAYSAIDRRLNPLTNPFGRDAAHEMFISRPLPLFPLAGPTIETTPNSAAKKLTGYAQPGDRQRYNELQEQARRRLTDPDNEEFAKEDELIPPPFVQPEVVQASSFKPPPQVAPQMPPQMPVPKPAPKPVQMPAQVPAAKPVQMPPQRPAQMPAQVPEQLLPAPPGIQLQAPPGIRAKQERPPQMLQPPPELQPQPQIQQPAPFMQLPPMAPESRPIPQPVHRQPAQMQQARMYPYQPGQLVEDSPMGAIVRMIGAQFAGQLQQVQSLPKEQQATAAQAVLAQMLQQTQIPQIPASVAQQEVKAAPTMVQKMKNWFSGKWF